MKTWIICLAFCLTCALSVQAQCPNSNRAGVHVIQPGETLYRLSKQYNVTLGELCAWNNMDISTVLPLCTEVKVTAPSANASTNSNANVAPDITEEDVPKGAPTEAYSAPSAAEGQIFHVLKQGETISSIAEFYGYTESRFRKFNNLPWSITELVVGSVLKANDCTCPVPGESGTTNNPKGSIAPPDIDEPNPNRGSKNTGSSTSTDMDAAVYMSAEERQMCNEINRLRAAPSAYVPYVRDYIKELQADGNNSAVAAANELINELYNTPNLSILRPSKCIYTAASRHAADQINTGDLNHQGTDGSWPWDRIGRTCPGESEAGENIVGGPSDIRRAVMLLLVDDGIDSRGHRRTLLDPQWNQVACHKVGQVGAIPNCWLQMFGK